jgi:PPPDE putative peptidase domain
MKTGIFCSRPKRCPMHHYRESVYLGDCELSSKQVNSILEDLRPIWLATSYNMFRNNCAFFSREFAIELGVGDIPVWVFSLASSAEFIEPYAIKLNTYLKNRTKIPRDDDKRPFRYKVSTSSPSQRHAEQLAVLLEENGSMEVQCAASLTQEMLLDHAMAARIQRNFRASSSRHLDVRQGFGTT